MLYNAVAECSIEGIQPSHYHRRSVFTDFIHTLDGRCSRCISHCESIDFVYDTGVYTDMSFASSCRVGWLAISGGELGCHCTPEAIEAGKPRRAFFYRLSHRIAPLRHKRGDLGCCCTPGTVEAGKPRRAFFYRLPHRIAHPRHNRGRVGLPLHAGGVQNRQAPACIFLPVATQDHTSPP